MSDVVLDASALIAYLRNEPGGAEIATTLPNSVISVVNLTEVVTRMIDTGLSFGQAKEIVTETSVATMLLAGILSLGDRACLGLARLLGIPALTADRRWSGLDIGVEIRLIRN